MPGNSSSEPSNIVYSPIGTESLRIARASNNPESFPTAIKTLIARMSRQEVSIGKTNSSILHFFSKHQAHNVLIMFVKIRKNCFIHYNKVNK